MKKLFNTVKNTAQTVTEKAKNTLSAFIGFSRRAVYGNAGEGYIDTAVKILIAVVLGALLLAGLYALFGDVVMPTLNERIRDMFNYAGNLN